MNMAKKHNDFLNKLVVGATDDLSQIRKVLNEIYPRSSRKEHLKKEELIEAAILDIDSAIKVLKMVPDIDKAEKENKNESHHN